MDGEEVRTQKNNRRAARVRPETVAARAHQTVDGAFSTSTLWSHMNVLENIIEAPVHVLGLKRKEAEDRAREYLEKVGLAPRLGEAVSVASVGRSAAARRRSRAHWRCIPT